MSLSSRHPDESTVKALASGIREQLLAPTADSLSFVQNAVTVLQNLSGDDLAAARIGALLDSAQFFYVAGQPFDGVGAARRAVTLADRIGDQSMLRKSLTFFGILCADTGNIPMATEAYARAHDLARALHDRPAEVTIWNNLGLALHHSAQYREAIACFERALDMADGDPELQFIRTDALNNIALSCLHSEDYHLGLRSIDSAVRQSEEPRSSSDHLTCTVREHTYTRLLLDVDNLPKARERAELAKHHALHARTARADIVASIAEGLYEVHAGLIDVGLSRLGATLEKARLMRAALRDTLIAMVKAHEIAGQPERALVYLRELLEHTRKMQQDNALRHLKLVDEIAAESTMGLSATTALERREAILRGKIAERELFKSRLEMLERLAVAAELRDDSTGEHSYRVGKLAALLATEYGCDDDTIFMLDLAGRLHDIGKIGVPDGILLKPGKLTETERQIMRAHTTVGAELLAKSNIPHMQMAEDIARYHHEWWDGGGYPSNLSGTAIPLAARITALADVFDALTHKRPYKHAWTIDDSIAEITSLRGKQFDPELTGYFLALIERLRREHGDLDRFLGQAARESPFLQARSKIWENLLAPPRTEVNL